MVTEIALGGTDVVMASVDFTLEGQEIEDLTLGGSAISGTGNALDNMLRGNGGNNLLRGLDGKDTLIGDSGADTMIGGRGDDDYAVDNVHDKVVELAGEGTDTVQSTVTYSLYGTAAENLYLGGNDSIDATGNDLNNELTGNNRVNVLKGGLGNDTLDGAMGDDTLIGGWGDDTYWADTAGDVVAEKDGQGFDTIIAMSTSYSLVGTFVEELVLLGGDDSQATGNSHDNVLYGNYGDNTLNGGYGADTLYGQGGADTFVFGTNSGFDTISDFSAAQNDRINVHAVAVGHAHAEWLTQVGGDVHIALGDGDMVAIIGATVADVSAHMVW